MHATRSRKWLFFLFFINIIYALFNTTEIQYQLFPPLIYPENIWWWFDFWCLTPLSAVFQLYHGDQF
jgi:hypothetical protein